MSPKRDSIATEAAVSLFLAAGLLFNFPILSLFNLELLLLGFPLLYVYLFLAWAGVILSLFFLSGIRSRRNRWM